MARCLLLSLTQPEKVVAFFPHTIKPPRFFETFSEAVLAQLVLRVRPPSSGGVVVARGLISGEQRRAKVPLAAALTEPRGGSLPRLRGPGPGAVALREPRRRLLDADRRLLEVVQPRAQLHQLPLVRAAGPVVPPRAPAVRVAGPREGARLAAGGCGEAGVLHGGLPERRVATRAVAGARRGRAAAACQRVRRRVVRRAPQRRRGHRRRRARLRRVLRRRHQRHGRRRRRRRRRRLAVGVQAREHAGHAAFQHLADGADARLVSLQTRDGTHREDLVADLRPVLLRLLGGGQRVLHDEQDGVRREEHGVQVLRDDARALAAVAPLHDVLELAADENADAVLRQRRGVRLRRLHRVPLAVLGEVLQLHVRPRRVVDVARQHLARDDLAARVPDGDAELLVALAQVADDADVEVRDLAVRLREDFGVLSEFAGEHGHDAAEVPWSERLRARTDVHADHAGQEHEAALAVARLADEVVLLLLPLPVDHLLQLHAGRLVRHVPRAHPDEHRLVVLRGKRLREARQVLHVRLDLSEDEVRVSRPHLALVHLARQEVAGLVEDVTGGVARLERGGNLRAVLAVPLEDVDRLLAHDLAVVLDLVHGLLRVADALDVLQHVLVHGQEPDADVERVHPVQVLLLEHLRQVGPLAALELVPQEVGLDHAPPALRGVRLRVRQQRLQDTERRGTHGACLVLVLDAVLEQPVVVPARVLHRVEHRRGEPVWSVVPHRVRVGDVALDGLSHLCPVGVAVDWVAALLVQAVVDVLAQLLVRALCGALARDVHCAEAQPRHDPPRRHTVHAQRQHDDAGDVEEEAGAELGVRALALDRLVACDDERERQPDGAAQPAPRAQHGVLPVQLVDAQHVHRHERDAEGEPAHDVQDEVVYQQVEPVCALKVIESLLCDHKPGDAEDHRVAHVHDDLPEVVQRVLHLRRYHVRMVRQVHA
eukprot:Rhum_TRINITY_DN14828_c6_g2::Rhum_TRINITY_DN14828_c6_g2_i3::g.123851::m.123851